jgi:ribosomal subunit interface protein
MHVQVHYQNLDNSPWLDQFIESRLEKLSRYLSPSASIQVNLKFEDRKYIASLVIHNLQKDYIFSAQGVNLYEAFSSAMEKSNRTLGDRKRLVKDKINKRFHSLKYTA